MERRTRKHQRPAVRNQRASSAPTPTSAGTSFDAQIYAQLFENANDAIALFDLDGTILLVNGGAERLLQCDREEIVGHHFRDFVTPESVTLAEQRTRDFLAGHKPSSSVFEVTLIRKDGTRIPV